MVLALVPAFTPCKADRNLCFHPLVQGIFVVGNLKLECGSCGAASMSPDGRSLWKCQYCSTVTIIDGIEADPNAELRENIARRTRKIESILRKPANNNTGNISDGGHLHLTKNEIVFVPHMFNFDSNYRLVFPLNDIKNISKKSYFGLIRYLFVQTKDSKTYKFVVWNQDAFINGVTDLINKS